MQEGEIEKTNGRRDKDKDRILFTHIHVHCKLHLLCNQKLSIYFSPYHVSKITKKNWNWKNHLWSVVFLNACQSFTDFFFLGSVKANFSKTLIFAHWTLLAFVLMHAGHHFSLWIYFEMEILSDLLRIKDISCKRNWFMNVNRGLKGD